MDQQLFIKICDEVIGQRQGMNGIGTLSEKTVHSVLKSYYSPDNINHEIKVGGFVADICTGNEIIEIQTRNFDKLRRKLTAFLAFAPVTIVYPVPHIKYLRWVNPQTGEISPPRKSPKLGTPYVIFDELYKIKDFLINPNLNLKIVLINLEEYRFLDGWSQNKKKGSTRCDRIPTELVREIQINNLAEYQLLIPELLGAEFTSKDFKKASGLPMHQAQIALNILHFIGAVDRIGKKGNAFLYVRTDGTTSSKQDYPLKEEMQTSKTKIKVNTKEDNSSVNKQFKEEAPKILKTSDVKVYENKKKQSVKQIPPKKEANKKESTKKASTEKVSAKKVSTKKVTTEMVSTKKASAKKDLSKAAPTKKIYVRKKPVENESIRDDFTEKTPSKNG